MVEDTKKGNNMKLRKTTEEMRFILATDVGSTTTKARFFRQKR